MIDKILIHADNYLPGRDSFIKSAGNFGIENLIISSSRLKTLQSIQKESPQIIFIYSSLILQDLMRDIAYNSPYSLNLINYYCLQNSHFYNQYRGECENSLIGGNFLYFDLVNDSKYFEALMEKENSGEIKKYLKDENIKRTSFDAFKFFCQRNFAENYDDDYSELVVDNIPPPF